MDFLKFIEDCENDLRTGNTRAITERMLKLNGVDVPRVHLTSIASICRRAGAISAGLRLLAPVVRQERKQVAAGGPATANEKAEYGVLLQRKGCVFEALTLLESIRPEDMPASLLYRAFCHFTRWEYESAVPLLERYLKGDLALYPRMIANVNLIAVYVVTERFDQVLTLAAECLEVCRANNFTRLHGNILELRAQVYMERGDFAAARADLLNAARLLSGDTSVDLLLVDRWQAVLDSMESRDPKALLEFRERAIKQRAWESVRDTDLHRLRIDFDQKTFEHLVFGTRFPNYRARIHRKLNRFIERDSYKLGDPRAKRTFDLRTGEGTGEELLKPGAQVHQVLAILARDFYKPWTIPGLFSELYRNDYFDIGSSPLRVHQALMQTRRWLEEASIPASIVESRGAYSLKVGKGFAFTVGLESAPTNPNAVRLARLKADTGGRWCKAREIGAHLNLEGGSVGRFLSWATQHGHIEKFGAGFHTLYRVPA